MRRLPRVKPLDTDVLRGSFGVGLWDSRKLSSSKWRVFSTGKEALRLSDMPCWYIVLRTKTKHRQATGKSLETGSKKNTTINLRRPPLAREPVALELYLQAQNIVNKSYKSHLSRAHFGNWFWSVLFNCLQIQWNAYKYTNAEHLGRGSALCVGPRADGPVWVTDRILLP